MDAGVIYRGVYFDITMFTMRFFLPNADGLDLMETLFQGQLVLRTRCLECESFTERREDFQDISVPVLDDSPSSPGDFSSGEEETGNLWAAFYSFRMASKAP